MLEQIMPSNIRFPEALVSNGYTLATTPDRLGRLEAVPEPARHNRAALWQRLENNGYLFLKGFFDAAEINQFRDYYFSALASTGLVKPGSEPVEGLASGGPIDQMKVREILFNEIVKGAEYQALCTSPELVEFFQWFLGGPVFLHKRKIIRHAKPGGGQATGAHYDLVYLREGTDRVLTAWLPLGDCAIQDGGLIYLEGSHKIYRQFEHNASQKIGAEWLTKDLPALANKLNTRWLVADFEAGDVVIHNAFMVHASLDNHNPDGRMRLSTDIRYQLASDSIDGRWQNHWHDKDGL